MSNQSHFRIDHFSFGEPTSGLLYPLDGEKLIQTSEAEEFNYILNVVPTKLDTSKFHRTETYQYAVTQHSKKAPEAGIHFRYFRETMTKVEIRDFAIGFWKRYKLLWVVNYSNDWYYQLQL